MATTPSKTENTEDKEQNVVSADAKVVNKPSDEMISVEKSKLEALFARIERLEASASKSALAHFDEKNREAPGKIVRVRVFEGKIVVGEKMTKNIVEKSPQGVWREDQEVEITFRDGTKTVLPYVFYVRAYKHIEGAVISEAKNIQQIDIDSVGDYLLKLRLDGNDVIEIGSKFVN